MSYTGYNRRWLATNANLLLRTQLGIRCVRRNRYSSELCPASARAIVKQVFCKNWVRLFISVKFYYTSYLQKWRQYAICRMGLFTDTNLPERGTKNFLNAMLRQQWDARTHFIQEYIRSHTPLAQKLLHIPSILTPKTAHVTPH